jgi:hypothetical protein
MMNLKQAHEIYKTYKEKSEDTIDMKIFLEVCEAYEKYLKQIKDLLLEDDNQIKKLKQDVDFYREIAFKGGQ